MREVKWSRREVRWSDNGVPQNAYITDEGESDEGWRLNVLRSIRDELKKKHPDAHIVEITKIEEIIE